MDVVGKVRFSSPITFVNDNFPVSFYSGVTSRAQDGFSQAASSQLPTGTWENGVFDYDHLKRTYLPLYTRHWDDMSKVPFIFNPSTGLWISYDDSESISLKNEYIKREKLAGAMFWELSSDRNAELISITYTSLNDGKVPDTTGSSSAATQTTTAATVTTVTTTKHTNDVTTGTRPDQTTVGPTTQRPSGSSTTWKAYVSYKVGDPVTFDGRTYACIQAHTALPDWTPAAVPALWKLT